MQEESLQRPCSRTVLGERALVVNARGWIGYNTRNVCNLSGPGHLEIVTIRDNGNYARVLIYSYCTTKTGWGGPPITTTE